MNAKARSLWGPAMDIIVWMSAMSAAETALTGSPACNFLERQKEHAFRPAAEDSARNVFQILTVIPPSVSRWPGHTYTCVWWGTRAHTHATEMRSTFPAGKKGGHVNTSMTNHFCPPPQREASAPHCKAGTRSTSPDLDRARRASPWAGPVESAHGPAPRSRPIGRDRGASPWASP